MLAAQGLLAQAVEEAAMVKIVGILLIVLGIVALIWGGLSYTREETILDVGPIEATAERRETIPLPPVLGGLALVGGVVLLVYGSRKP